MNKYKHRNVLSLAKRVQVIKDYNLRFPKPKFDAFAKKYNISSSQLRGILLNQQSILVDYAKVPSNEVVIKSQPDSFLYKNRNILSLADRAKVIREYTSRTPKPTFNALAIKYNVSCGQITNILLNQESILKLYHETREDTIAGNGSQDMKLNQRQYKLEFLGKVIYEYVQRSLYYNVSIDDDTVLQKANEVKDCIAVKNFRPTILWLMYFKNAYGIDDLSLESLQTKIAFTEVKHRQLDTVDLVRYVRQQEIRSRKSHSQTTGSSSGREKITHPIEITQPLFEEVTWKPSAAKRQNSNSPHLQQDDLGSDSCTIQELLPHKKKTSQIDEDAIVKTKKINLYQHFNPPVFEEEEKHVEKLTFTPHQLKENNETEIVYEKIENRLFNLSDIDNAGSHINADEAAATIKIEFSPTQLGAGIAPHLTNGKMNNEPLTSALLGKNLRSNSPLTSTADSYQEIDVSGVTVNTAIVKVEMSTTQSNENNEQDVIFERVFDEVLTNLTPNQILRPDNVVNNLQRTDVNASTVNELIIKRESDDAEFITIYKSDPKTNEKQSSNLSQFDVENHLPEMLVIKQEPMMSDDEIDPKNIHGVFNDGTNMLQTSKSLQALVRGINSEEVIDNKELASSQLSEDIQSQIVLESVMDPCCRDQSSTLPINKGQHSKSSLHGIDSLEEAMKYLKLLEDYAMLEDNSRAVHLLLMLGEAFKKQDK